MAANPKLEGNAVVPAAIEENVWQGIEDLFMKSPACRALVKEGKVKVVGAVYGVGTGKVQWLPEAKVGEIMAKVEASPNKATVAMAGGAEPGHH